MTWGLSIVLAAAASVAMPTAAQVPAHDALVALHASYQMGKLQMEQLLADRARQLGDRFVLREFHDEFLSKGSIPIALTRYEMTGLDDEVRGMFTPAPPPPVPSGS